MRQKAKKILFPFFITLPLFSCSSHISNKSTQYETTSASDDSVRFLLLFQPINPSGLHIYPPSDTVQGAEFKFKGQPIDSTFYRYFSSQGWDPDSTRSQLKVFACFKFDISKTKKGLIIRRPSQYSETAIDLCIWDNDSKKITNEIEVSDGFGDGEWYFKKDAWLVDLNKDGQLDIVTRQKDWDGEDTTHPEGIVRDSLKVYIAKGDSFRKALFPLDTTKFQVLNWDN